MSMNGRLRDFRKKLGMSQVEFAKALGVTQANISLLERSIGRESKDGKIAKPSARLIERIAMTFPSLNMNWLFHNIGPVIYDSKETLLQTGEIQQRIEELNGLEERLEDCKKVVESLKKDKEELIRDKKDLRQIIDDLRERIQTS